MALLVLGEPEQVVKEIMVAQIILVQIMELVEAEELALSVATAVAHLVATVEREPQVQFLDLL